jgi:hypothetical protein
MRFRRQFKQQARDRLLKESSYRCFLAPVATLHNLAVITLQRFDRQHKEYAMHYPWQHALLVVSTVLAVVAPYLPGPYRTIAANIARLLAALAGL